LDKGNKPATVVKKTREIKVLFETAVARKQLEENPFKIHQNAETITEQN
jgi:hypothetical protein